MPILKADVQAPVLPPERLHQVPGVGEVIVRPLLLSDRLGLQRESMNGLRYKYMASLLALTVVDANHEPIYTTEEWEVWGGGHYDEALVLWDVAFSMSGFVSDDGEKKSTLTPAEVRVLEIKIAMRLALKLGRTLEELGNSMTSQEFSLWLEVYSDDYWGEMGAYQRAGIVAAAVGNYAGKTLRDDAEPLQPRDFMPLERPAEPAEEPDPVAYFQNVAKQMDLKHAHS